MLLRYLSYGKISPYFSISNSLFGNNNPYKILRNRRCSRMLIILIRTIVLYFIILFEKLQFLNFFKKTLAFFINVRYNKEVL